MNTASVLVRWGKAVTMVTSLKKQRERMENHSRGDNLAAPHKAAHAYSHFNTLMAFSVSTNKTVTDLRLFCFF